MTLSMPILSTQDEARRDPEAARRDREGSAEVDARRDASENRRPPSTRLVRMSNLIRPRTLRRARPAHASRGCPKFVDKFRTRPVASPSTSATHEPRRPCDAVAPIDLLLPWSDTRPTSTTVPFVPLARSECERKEGLEEPTTRLTSAEQIGERRDALGERGPDGLAGSLEGIQVQDRAEHGVGHWPSTGAPTANRRRRSDLTQRPSDP